MYGLILKKETEITGWWNGRAGVDGRLSRKKYETFFDTAYLTKEDESMILGISQMSKKEKSLNDDIVPASMLCPDARKQVLEQIYAGDMAGTIERYGQKLNWSWAPDVRMEGMADDISIDFMKDLSEGSRMHIAKTMLEDECQRGEVVETVDYTYIITVPDDTFDGTSGSIRITAICTQTQALNEEVYVGFEYSRGTGEVAFTNDEMVPRCVTGDIEEFIRSIANKGEHNEILYPY